VGIDLWTAPDEDPCEIRFTGRRDDDPTMPLRMDVHRGAEPFGTFVVERVERTGGDR
jgi:hypothetical protein